METKVNEATTIRLVEETNNKIVYQIRDNLQTKAITEVVLQVKEEVMEENMTKVILSDITVRSMDNMQGNIEEERKKIKKMMQDL